MHLALIIDDYLPNSTRVGAKMFHELARKFVELGHDVTVIAPSSDIRGKLKVSSIDGVEIWEFKSLKLKGVSKIRRAVGESLLSYFACNSIRDRIENSKFDGIIYYSPSIFFGGLVKFIKSSCNCPAYLVLRDFFPQWVIDAGMLKSGSLIERYFRFFERRLYRQADMIGVMSEKNKKIFENANEGFSVQVLRNWADIKINRKKVFFSYRKKLNLEGKVIYFYGGNIGKAQDMSNLMRLAKNMTHIRDAHFLFVGQGDEVELICELAKKWKLSNFTYLPSVSQDEFSSILEEIDVGLFSLSLAHSSHNFPGKLLGYMAHGKPILGSVNMGNDLMPLVNDSNAGFIYVNGEDEKLLESALSFRNDVALKEKTGMNAKKLLKDEFSVDMASNAVIEEIEIARTFKK